MLFLYGLVAFYPLDISIVQFWSASFQKHQLSSSLPSTTRNLHSDSIQYLTEFADVGN